MQERHSLALLYNDKSVAENNSAYKGLQLLSADQRCDVFAWSSEQERREFRRLVIAIVLSTDIGDADGARMLQLRVQEGSATVSGEGAGVGDKGSSTTAGAGALDWSAPSSPERTALLCLLLKAADIGSSMQTFDT